jgi:predicted TIM-barrel fold metal-dependent hydrolase
MDEAGIAVSVLSLAPLGGIGDEDFLDALCRTANDGLAEACAAHPDRFVMAATLPLPWSGRALRELERIGGEGPVRAIHITADATDYRPDEPALERVFETIAGLRLPIILHPAAGAADLAPAFDAYGLGSGMHAMVSHALVAARIMGSGMLDRIPALELIVTHLGGILPFLIDRMDSRHKGASAQLPSYYLRNRLFLDCCGMPAGPALRCALETVGAERLVLGSDWPSRPIAPALEAIRALALPPAAEAAILEDNAARWFSPGATRLQ